MKPLLKTLARALFTAALLTPALVTATSSQASAPAPNACTDFDDYVNGTWKATTELPADRARVGSFDQLARGNDKLLAAALAELAARPGLQSTPALTRLAAYYRSGMDLAAIDKAGLAAVAPLLQRVNAVTREGLPAMLAELARHQVAAPLSLFVAPDAKDVRRNVLTATQAGLGLPDRDDYAKTDATTLRIKAAYRQHAATLLTAADLPADGAALEALLAFESRLADASMTRVQRRDPNASYNPFTVAELQAHAPGLDWKALLAAYSGRAAGVPLILGQPLFAQAVAELARDAPLATWRSYLSVRLLDATAQHLPRALAQSYFNYHSVAQRGLKAPPPRVEQVILQIGGATGGAPMGEALGQLFAAQAFSPLAQQRAFQMIGDIREGMRQRVKASPWMSPATQTLALEKLDAMVAKIGVPERWKTFDGLDIQADDYAGNLLRSLAWVNAERLADLDKPVDRIRWNTSPHIVNAFAGGGNQIIFPAGILQPPFFDASADDASNYGAIGMIIGHEITHHFDDRGRQFDSVGNLRDWWTAADAAAYKARADRTAALYSGYEPLPGERINGRQTLGENLSDLGGMQIAYVGLQIALERQRKAGLATPLIEGRTPEQRFFMSNAVVWRSKQRDEALINQLRTGQHSPGRFRVLGPMSNMTSFAQAFGCKAGDAMVAAEPIVVW